MFDFFTTMTKRLSDAQVSSTSLTSISEGKPLPHKKLRSPFAVLPNEVNLKIISSLDNVSKACLALTSRQMDCLVSKIHPSDEDGKPRKLVAICPRPEHRNLSLYGDTDFELLHRRLILSTSKVALKQILKNSHAPSSRCRKCSKRELVSSESFRWPMTFNQFHDTLRHVARVRRCDEICELEFKSRFSKEWTCAKWAAETRLNRVE